MPARPEEKITIPCLEDKLRLLFLTPSPRCTNLGELAGLLKKRDGSPLRRDSLEKMLRGTNGRHLARRYFQQMIDLFGLPWEHWILPLEDFASLIGAPPT